MAIGEIPEWCHHLCALDEAGTRAPGKSSVGVYEVQLDDSTPRAQRLSCTRGLRAGCAIAYAGPAVQTAVSPGQNEVFRISAAIAAEISRVHRRDPIDIIDMEESFGWFADVARLTALPLLVRLHGPAFLTMTGDELEAAFGREKIEREGQALRLAAAIASPSQANLTQTIRRYGLTPKEARHIVNPLDMDSNTPRWSLERCERDTILFVGRFDLIKGADVLLKAFRKLLQERPKLKLIFVGPDSGLIGLDQKRTHFDEYCASLFPAPLRGRVDYRGPVGNRQVAELRVQAMVTVVASRWESPGYTLSGSHAPGVPGRQHGRRWLPRERYRRRYRSAGESPRTSMHYAAQLRLVLDDPQGAAATGGCRAPAM
jgi:glycosyltransferase involved in cell wall biosynthesis